MTHTRERKIRSHLARDLHYSVPFMVGTAVSQLYLKFQNDIILIVKGVTMAYPSNLARLRSLRKSFVHSAMQQLLFNDATLIYFINLTRSTKCQCFFLLVFPNFTLPIKWSIDYKMRFNNWNDVRIDLYWKDEGSIFSIRHSVVAAALLHYYVQTKYQ